MSTSPRPARRPLAALATVAVFVCLAVSITAGPAPSADAWSGPTRAIDANTTPRSSSPGLLTPAGSKLFTVTSDTDALWAIAQGGAVTRLTDFGGITPRMAHVPSRDGVVVFTKFSIGVGTELWRSDGTVAGTRLVRDIRPGASSSSPNWLTQYRGDVYFTANDGTDGTELWRTDGDQAWLVADLNSGAASSSPANLTVVAHEATDERLWMIASSPAGTPDRLVVYNGNEHETASIDLGGRPTGLTAVNGVVYATGLTQPGNPAGLHRIVTTGANTYTATFVVARAVNEMFAFGDRLLISAPDPTRGPELFELVGNNFVLIKEIRPGSTGSNPRGFVESAGFVYFAADDGTTTGRQLWRTDGSAAGTVRAATIGHTSIFNFSGPYPLTALPGGGLAFTARSNALGEELWIKPPTTAVDDAFALDIAPGTAGSRPSKVVTWGTRLVLAADDRTHGQELMELSVSAPPIPDDAKVALLADLAPGTGHSTPEQPARAGDRVVFSAWSPTHGRDLYATDSASGVTTRIDPAPGSYPREPDEITSVGERAVFVGYDDEAHRRLWTTDGTPAGTAVIGASEPWKLTTAGKLVYFIADGAEHYELWRTDGTPAGTFRVFAATGADSVWFGSFAPLGDRVVFSAEIDDELRLYVSDGTPSGTQPFGPSLGDANLYELVGVGDQLFASVASSGSNSQLWVFGADSGRRLTPTAASLDGVWDLVAFGTGVVFAGDTDGGEHEALWVSDGTDAGTRLLSPSSSFDSVDDVTVLGDRVLATVREPAHGRELWVSDGSPGSLRVLEIAAGPAGSDPENLATLNGFAYFRAHQAASGSQVWRTDGQSVERVTSLGAGASYGVGADFVAAVGNQIWFPADDGTTGLEPWYITDSAPPAAPGSVRAVAGNRSATVSWTAPTTAADAPVLGYRVAATPGGQTCTAQPPATSCTVRGLTNGTDYRFSVTATNRVGAGVASALSNPVRPHDNGGGSGGPGAETVIVPVAPARYWDTRPGEPTGDGRESGTGRLSAGATYEVPVAGRMAVPDDATAVVANLTVILPDDAGFATIYPCSPERPDVSAANYFPGDVLANNVVVPLSANGTVCVFSHAGADFALDVNGYVDAGAPDTTVAPARYLDTRGGEFGTFDGTHSGGGRPAAGSITRIQVAGRGDVPAGATAAMVNLTAVLPDGDGYLTAYPCTDEVPWASTANYLAGQVVPNGGVVPLSATGELCVSTHAGTDILLDVTGFVPAGAGSVVSLEPARLFDSRPGEALVDGTSSGPRLAADATVKVQVTGRHGIPGTATAALLNVAVVEPDGPTFVTLFACDDPGTAVPPQASNLNLANGGVRANNALTALSDDGSVCIYTRAGSDVVLDVTGFLR